MTSWLETRNSLIRRLADPDAAQAWGEFESRYQPAIYRFVRSRGLQPSDARDCREQLIATTCKPAWLQQTAPILRFSGEAASWSDFSRQNESALADPNVHTPIYLKAIIAPTDDPDSVLILVQRGLEPRAKIKQNK